MMIQSWQLVLPGSAAQVLLSEIRIDQPGTDVDEYIELSGPAGADLSTYSLIVIGDGAGGSGVVEVAVALEGLQIPNDGYALIAESSLTLGPLPDLTATLNLENSDNVTYLLVSSSTASSGLDLDVDDDGSLDHAPWESVVDCVAILDTVDGGDRTYCSTSIGPDGGSSPFHVYLDGGWQIGPRDPSEGIDTPGAAPAGLPLEVTRLDWLLNRGEVFLNWAITGSCDCTGFRVRLVRGGSREVVGELEIDDRGQAYSEYVLPLPDLRPGRNYLDLAAVAPDGTERSIGALTISVPAKQGFTLTSPFPNPTPGAFRFEVSSGLDTPVNISIYDAAGRVVKNVLEGRVGPESTLSVAETLNSMPPGVYFLVARTSDFRRVKTVIRV